MTTMEKVSARHLLTYGEAMLRLLVCYQSGIAVKEWQAYVNCEPAFFGVCFLPNTPADYTALAARNALMQCYLSFDRDSPTQTLLFRVLDSSSTNP
jgi:hypothetical protein